MKKNRGDTNVNTELDRAAYHKQEAVKTITDVSRMLASPKEQAKVVMMKELRWDQALSRTERELGQEKERSSVMSALHHSAVSKLQEIKEIAVTYDLKFLPASNFLCPEKREYELTSMLSDFMEEKDIDNTAFSKNSFHILADEKYFAERHMDIDDDIGVFVFYLPPKQNDNFVRVNNFGSGELTTKRYFRGWRRKEPLNGIIHACTMGFLVAFPLFGLLTGGSFWRTFIASILVAALSATAVIHGSRKKGGFSSHTWNQLPPRDN